MKQYERRPDGLIIAIQIRLDLEAGGIAYRKWDSEQWGKRGDWLINDDGDTYTVSAENFANDYELSESGLYRNTAKVWAEEATGSGFVEIRGGTAPFVEGNMLVFSDPDRKEGQVFFYNKFNRLYRPVGG